MKPIARDFPCTTPSCATAGKRRHVLVPTPSGAAWECEDCHERRYKITHAQMRGFIANVLRHLPSIPKTAAPYEGSLEHVKVFFRPNPALEHTLELAPPLLARHVEITGGLPVVGEPLFTTVPDISSDLLRLPYGLVVRVETSSQ